MTTSNCCKHTHTHIINMLHTICIFDHHHSWSCGHCSISLRSEKLPYRYHAIHSYTRWQMANFSERRFIGWFILIGDNDNVRSKLTIYLIGSLQIIIESQKMHGKSLTANFMEKNWHCCAHLNEQPNFPWKHNRKLFRFGASIENAINDACDPRASCVATHSEHFGWKRMRTYFKQTNCVAKWQKCLLAHTSVIKVYSDLLGLFNTLCGSNQWSSA